MTGRRDACSTPAQTFKYMFEGCTKDRRRLTLALAPPERYRSIRTTGSRRRHLEQTCFCIVEVSRYTVARQFGTHRSSFVHVLSENKQTEARKPQKVMFLGHGLKVFTMRLLALFPNPVAQLNGCS